MNPVNRLSRHQPLSQLLVLLLVTVATSACSIGYRATSPEVRYSRDSDRALALQVPPDLTDVREGEQFVLPGTSGGPVTRDTLLPEFESVRFLRNGKLSWLESLAAPEALWPRLQAFIRSEGMQVAGTQPTTGLITTQWQAVAVRSLLFPNLSGNDYQRAAFRLERTSTGSRLFVRLQLTDKASATAAGADTVNWPASSHDEEQTGLLLQRLLIFLGLEEQKAKGILNQSAADAVLDEATLEVSSGGTRLVLHQGYRPSLELVAATLDDLGFTSRSADVPGLINVIDSASLVDDRNGAYALRVESMHVSAVKISVVDSEGNPVDASAARKLLSVLRDRLA